MKYVLILSLFYKHYKKSSTLKLFLDNRFIDEIVLDKNISHIPNVEQRFANIIDGVATDVHKNSNWVLRRLNKITTAPLDPEIQLPNKIWLKFGEILSFITSPIIMFLIFVSAFLPTKIALIIFSVR